MALTVRRFASMDDAERMIHLGRKMHAEGHFAFLPFDEDELLSLARGVLACPDQYAGFICEDANGDVFAMMLGFVAKYYFCKEKYAADLFIYVHPDNRGGIGAARIVSAFEEWARAHDAREVIIGLRVSIDNNRAMRFFTGIGYRDAVPLLTKRIA